jgi:hypothetical protein
VTVYTDHKNLEYFMTARVLNRHQARWNMSLSRFDFIITYRPRKQQGLIDDLFRRSSLAPKEGYATYEQQRTTLLKTEQLRSTPVDSSFFNQVRTVSSMDPQILNIKHRSNNNDEIFKFIDDLLYFEEPLYIPKGPTRFQIL